MSAACPAVTVTPAQIEAARKLIELALEEERDRLDRHLIRLADEKVVGMAREGAELWRLRQIVEQLHVFAVPGGVLHETAGAWLALRENGGEA
ncbi:MAG: hypothetical protein ABI134_35255 [Byssovorax sp.]